jgi:putative iron-dependent peroxidase
LKQAQAGILAPVPAMGRYAFFSIAAKADAAALRAALQRLQALANGPQMVVGIGPLLVAAIGAQVPGLREMPHLNEHGVDVPSTPTALWCWLRGSDRGELVLQTHTLENALAPALHLDRVVDAFRHGDPKAQHGRDLTGYEDGTENPEGEDAEAAALVQGQGEGRDGASFVAVQQWVHDLNAFEAMSTTDQDNAMGRRRSDNEELEDAPETSHVKRTAQESFAPEAFVLRRSMPWATSNKLGLLFVAFGSTLDSFEAQMRRMAGYEDGLIDGLFKFSKPVNGAYFWCPPVKDGRIDLRQLGFN